MSTSPAQMKVRQVPVTEVYDWNARATKPVVVNVGGADSSKSYSIAQLFVQKFKNERNKTFLITRKTLPSLRLTAYKLIIDMLKDYDHYRYLKHNKSERTLYYRAKNNFMVFTSLDDPEKVKSMEFNYVWMEEAGEFTWYDFITLKKCRRAKTNSNEPNRMYLSLNPVDELGWINQRLTKEDDVEIIKSTYMNNPFAQTADIEMLEGLKSQDETFWKIYARGEYAKLKGWIHKLQIIKEPYPECKETIYGLDFGFVNPNALLQIDIDMEHMSLYLTELLYESGMTNENLKDRLKVLIDPDYREREIYADSAEPARIQEIYEEGFNIRASDKSVTDGIDCVNRFKLYSHEDNVNVNREISGYKRKIDRQGNVLEEPVKFHDHCPNALRYPVYTHLRDRLVSFTPEWTYHIGMKDKKESEEKEKGKTADKKEPKEKKEESSEDKSWVL